MKTILISVDALRADHLGQYGYHRNTMPVLGRLDDRATKFESAFSNGPHTVRSVPSLLTSRRLVTDLGAGETVGSILSEAGIETAAFHSNTALDVAYGEIPGFDTHQDYMDELNGADQHQSVIDRAKGALRDGLTSTVAHSPLSKESIIRLYDALPVSPLDLGHETTVYVDASQVTSDIISWIDDHADEDFFLWVHYMDPHRPYGVGLTDPAYASGGLDDHHILQLVERAYTEAESLDTKERQYLVDLYDSEIRHTSEQIRRLFDALERHDIWDETNLVFTSDHGEEFDEHGMYDHQNRPYDELIRVPLYVKDSSERTARVAEQRELVDVLPTICDFHAIQVNHEIDGTNLFEGGSRVAVSTGSIRDNDKAIAVRTDDYKYIHVANDEPELYDLDDDPEESRSVHESDSERCESMADRIPPNLLKKIDGIALTEQRETDDKQVQDRLEDLGYLK